MPIRPDFWAATKSAGQHYNSGMAPSGRKPKPPGQAVTRHPHSYGWIDIEQVPVNGPKLPPRRRDNSPWPNGIAEKWRAWASMPHCGAVGFDFASGAAGVAG